MINERQEKQDAFDQADNLKRSLEQQIETLADLKFTTTNEDILVAIDEKIDDFNTQIEEAIIVIEDAQTAFNAIAEETIIIVQKRQEEVAEIERLNKFTDAKATYERIQSDITSYTNRLQYFDEDQAAADDEEKLAACEPRFLYELDAAGLPQISQEAVDIITAIGAGIIDPGNYNPSVALPSNIETKPSELMKLF